MARKNHKYEETRKKYTDLLNREDAKKFAYFNGAEIGKFVAGMRDRAAEKFIKSTAGFRCNEMGLFQGRTPNPPEELVVTGDKKPTPPAVETSTDGI